MITDTDSILNAAARMGMAHNNGAAGQFILVGDETQLKRFAHEVGSLDGLRRELLNPPTVARDVDGWWTNPALPDLGEGTSYKLFCEALDLEFVLTDADGVSDEIWETFEQTGSISAWTPEPPKGNGWVTLSIHDTEDGPVAMFVRPPVDRCAPMSEPDLEQVRAATNDTLMLLQHYVDALQTYMDGGERGTAQAAVDAKERLHSAIGRLAYKSVRNSRSDA